MAKTPALLGTYVAAAVLGYVLGHRGYLPKELFPEPSTPLARVGFALNEENPTGGSADWAGLRRDVEAVRTAYKPQDLPVFELVAAVRGLENGGSPDLARAEGLCRSLKWPRCDKPALEELRRRSRP